MNIGGEPALIVRDVDLALPRETSWVSDVRSYHLFSDDVPALIAAVARDKGLADGKVAIETQSTFGYTQNAVVRSLTPNAPVLAGIVEELFPAEAIRDLKAFFGAADDADLQQRLGRMLASTSAFGANENIDTVPTSRYVLKTPFHS